MDFRTKLDFSSNRQIKQRPETFTVLSGGTVFGVPFSALTKGPDLTTTGLTNTITGLTSTFSGNSAVTVYNWANPYMNLATSSLAFLIPALSATTQYAQGFSGFTTTTIDGNLVNLTYSGVNFDVTPVLFVDLGSGHYSGTVHTNTLLFLTAGTLDFTGRTIWADVCGITRTDKLLVNNDATFSNIGSQASAGSLHYTSGGTLTVNTSDGRLKTNITPVTNALAKVLALKGVYYNWIENPTGEKRIGFIAQDVQKIVPELAFVNNNSHEKYLGVHYDNVSSLLVEAIKELVTSGTTHIPTSINTQTIVAEDNNIELNFAGNHDSSIGGGLTVLHAKNDNENAEFKINSNGDWVTNNNIVPKGLIIPFFTPETSSYQGDNAGMIAHDDEFIYIKTKTGWKRSKLETF